MLKEVAASIGAAAATGTILDASVVDMLANSLENLATCMDTLSDILEAYTSKEKVNEN